MAKIDYIEVACKCGHTETRKISYMKGSEHDSKVEFENGRNEECSLCAAARRTKEQGLPELTGSEKQITWACSIREKAVKKIATIAPEYVEILMAAVQNETSAKFYIDNRDDVVAAIAKSLPAR